MIKDSLIEECNAVYGGGIYLRNRLNSDVPGSQFNKLRIANCYTKVKANSNKIGGGGGAFIKLTYPEFKDCYFGDNKAEGTYSCGGGIYFGYKSQGKLESCKIVNNKAEAEGGGIYMYNIYDVEDDSLSGIVLIKCQVSNNISHGSGGGISGFNSRIKVQQAQFIGNTVNYYKYSDGKHGARGGGIFLLYNNKYNTNNDKTATRILDCEFINNKVGVNIDSNDTNEMFVGGGLAIYSKSKVPLDLKLLRFSDNKAPSGDHVAVPSSENYQIWNGKWDKDTSFNTPNNSIESYQYIFK